MRHDVEVLLLEHLAVVAVEPRPLLATSAAGDDVGRLGELLLVDVAQRDDLDRRDLDQAEQVALAVPAAADQADALGLLVGDLLGDEALLRGGAAARRDTGSGGRGGDELAAVHGEAPGEGWG